MSGFLPKSDIFNFRSFVCSGFHECTPYVLPIFCSIFSYSVFPALSNFWCLIFALLVRLASQREKEHKKLCLNFFHKLHNTHCYKIIFFVLYLIKVEIFGQKMLFVNSVLNFLCSLRFFSSIFRTNTEPSKSATTE